MHIMPRWHIETDPSTSRYFVTFSLEYPKGTCLIRILAQWYQHNIQHPLATKLKISQTLHDTFLQDWNATINTTSKGRNYKLFKMNTNFETFLISLPRSSSIPMVKFRTANHKLPIEVGRWENIVYEIYVTKTT